MPWEERAKSLKEFYGVNVSDKTLRSWCSKLINVGSMAKIDGVNIYWNTYINAMGEKVRALVDGDEELEQELAQYKADRNELLKTMNWGEANKVLWSRYGSCFYSCKAIGLSAFDDIGKLQEIYELAEEIIQ